jgi:hypothetical protein
MGLTVITAKAGIDSLHQGIGIFNPSFKKRPGNSDSTSGIGGLKSQFLPNGTDAIGPSQNQFPAKSTTKTVVDLLFITLNL